MMRDSITFITGNEGKAKYVSEYCDVPLKHLKLDLPEIQSLSLHEIVEDKARRAHKELKKQEMKKQEIKKSVLVEDVSLTFHALGGLPGPLIKWFLSSLGNEGLCRLLDGYGSRKATARVLFALFTSEGDSGELKFFEGEKEGKIAKTPRGTAGYGWDTIFIPDGYSLTWGEMSEEDQAETSMRKEALAGLKREVHSMEQRNT